MADLEQLVRPFAPFEVLRKGKTYKPEPSVLDGTTVWIFGSAGDDAFSLRASTQDEVDNSGTDVEIKRKYDVVRVKDPDNPDNHFDVEVMKEYEARNQISEDRIRIRFKQQDPTDTVEILERNKTRVNTDT